MDISVVVPVYGSVDSLNELYSRLVSSISSLCEDFEIVLVNDASPDNSWDVIKSLANKDSRVKGINLSRNFGQHYAISAGLAEATGSWIVVMDCDLQDQPEEIPKLFAMANNGYDIVFGKRVNRKDSKLKKLSSVLFYKTLSYLTGTHQEPSIANFGIYSSKAIDAVLSMKDHIKYFPVMIRWVGFATTAIEIEHSKRFEGKSSYSVSALFSLAIDIMLSFSDKPLRIAAKAGFFISLISFLTSIFIAFQVIFNNVSVPGWASTVISLWFLGGVVIMVLGIVGIYVGKTFDQVKDRPCYILKERTWK